MNRLGYAAVSAAAILWAAGAAVASRLFERGATPLELTAARAWVAALGIGALVLARKKSKPPETALAIPFGLAIAAVNFTYYFAISRLPVAIAIVIQYTAPGLVVLFTAVTTKSAPSRRIITALVASFAGVVLLAELPQLATQRELRLDALGLLAAIASAGLFATYMLLGERMGARFGTDGALARGFAVASIFWLAIVAPRGRPDALLDPSFAAGIAFVTIGATIAPFLLFLWGLGRIGSARAGIASTLEPLAAALLALLFLDQSLTAQQLAGGVLVVIGITVVQTEQPRSPTVAAEAAAVE